MRRASKGILHTTEEQILGQEHYEIKHTKPLLNKYNLMKAHNLYVYHCSMDTFKTLKYRIPISLYSLYLGYQYIISCNTINSDMTTSIGLFKEKLNKLLLEIQKEGSPCEWENFNTMVT